MVAVAGAGGGFDRAIEPAHRLLKVLESVVRLIVEQQDQTSGEMLLGLGAAVALEPMPIVGGDR